MKPCRKNRKPITWLALDALDAEATQALRAHIQTCAGCHGYFEEISRVTTTLRMAQPAPDVKASSSFHRNVLHALKSEGNKPAWSKLMAALRLTSLNWRVALSVLGAAAVVLVVASVLFHRPAGPAPDPRVAQIPAATSSATDLAPTLSNYQTLANQSLDKLDEVLTRQANQRPAPASIYTASAFSSRNVPD